MKTLTTPVKEGSQIPLDIPPSDQTRRIIVGFEKRKGQCRIVIHADQDVLAPNFIDATPINVDNS